LKILRVIAPGWPGSAIARTRLIHGVSDVGACFVWGDRLSGRQGVRVTE
jgi:hypothetical protein